MMRIVLGIHRFYARIRHREATSAATAELVGTLDDVARRRHCLVVTYRRDGRAVPTPVWFAVADGRIFFRAEAVSGKAKRLRNNTAVRVAPCNSRGKPLGPPLGGEARILAGHEAAQAEAVIQARYSLGRRLYERWFTLPDGVYVEVTPTVTGSPGDDPPWSRRRRPAPSSEPSTATSR